MDPQQINDALSRMADHYGLSAGELRVIAGLWRELGRPHHFESGALLLRAGAHPTHIYLLVKGLVRSYYTRPDGQFHNKAFKQEGMDFSSLAAFFTGTTSKYNIGALEPSDLLGVEITTVRQLVKTHPEVARLLQAGFRDNFVSSEEREAILLTCNAEQRYHWVQRRHPWLLERIPQYHLAAYLGMTPVSLSRVKRAVESSMVKS